MLKKIPTTERGFTLLEVVVAIGLLIMVFGGVTGLAILNSEAGKSSKNNLVAAYLAKEGQELVRYKRDLNYILLVSPFSSIATESDGAVLYFTINYDGTVAAVSSPDVTLTTALGNTGSVYAQGSGTASIFHRLVTTTYHAAAGVLPARIDVKVDVYWKEDTKQSTYTLTSELTDWR